MTEKERHPFKPYIPENATKLVIGTIPPPRFAKKELSECDVDFYYGSEDNNFWKVIGEIAGVDFKKKNSVQEIEKRKNFLKNNNIGICDIVLKTNRKNPDSASDENLTDIEYLNIIDEILAEYPKIDTLLYTSNYVKTQMTQLLKKVFGREICHNKVETVILNENKEKNLKINNKVYQVFILYSPSPNANRRVSLQQKKEQYKKYLDI